MSKSLTCTLIADGSSDRMLLSPLRWLLEEQFPDRAIELTFADLRGVLDHTASLSDRIRKGLSFYPCDLLFIHRDAEKESFEQRTVEIEAAIQGLKLTGQIYLPIVPVRMTEAWFLHDEQAIRDAANNPNGKTSLEIPSAKRVHELPDPKENLERLLIQASELSSRRLKRFRPRQRMHRLAELINDFSPLRQQESFCRIENDLQRLHTTLLLE